MVRQGLLPGGLAAVIFHPENGPDGYFALVSDSRRFEEASYYCVYRTGDGALRVKRVPMEEAMLLFVDSAGILHAHRNVRLQRDTVSHPAV